MNQQNGMDLKGKQLNSETLFFSSSNRLGMEESQGQTLLQCLHQAVMST